MAKPYKDEDYRYKPVDYHNSTDVGADKALLSTQSQAIVQGFKDTWAEGDAAYKKAQTTGDQAGMDAAQKMMDEAHAGAEAERAKYGYQGGANGGAYNPLAKGGTGTETKAPKTSYGTAPTYTSGYQNEIKEMTAQIKEREPFSYAPETDPTYQQYKEQYTRSGEQAMEDTLGQVSARTGGYASSYAGSAAQQSYNSYMSALNDKIPELRQLAYQMYRNEGDALRADLNMLLSLEQGDYMKYQNELGQYNTDREFDFRADQEAYDRQQDRAEKADRLLLRTHDWDREAKQDATDAHEREVGEAVDIYSATGDVTRLAEAWGLTPEMAQILTDDYAQQKRLTKREDAREQLGYILTNGGRLEDVDPDLVAAAGLDDEYLKALVRQAWPEQGYVGAAGESYKELEDDLVELQRAGASPTQINSVLANAREKGAISYEQWLQLRGAYIGDSR